MLKNNTNILERCSVYLAGPMEYVNDGQDWRKAITEKLLPLNLKVFNPYENSFIRTTEESDSYRAMLQSLRASGEYDELATLCKELRVYDLSYVDRCDMLICFLDTSVFSMGTLEELTWANRLKKPIFVIVKQGKLKAPLWLFGMIPHIYIYNNIDEVTDIIFGIAQEKIKIGDNRLKLLQPQFR